MLKVIQGSGNSAVYQKIRDIALDSKMGINLAYDTIGSEHKKAIIQDLDSPNKTGRIYIITKDGQQFIHQASAPGEPPATMFGNLKASIMSKPNGSDRLTLSAGNTDVKYAARLELGDPPDKPRPRIEKRPYLRKAIDDKAKDTAAYFIQMLEKELGELK